MDEAGAIISPLFKMRKSPAQWQTLVWSQGWTWRGLARPVAVLLATLPAPGHFSSSFENGSNAEHTAQATRATSLPSGVIYRHLALKRSAQAACLPPTVTLSSEQLL